MIKTKLISLNITEDQLKNIELFVKLKKYPNKSEAIRNFIDTGIKLELGTISITNKIESSSDIFKMDVPDNFFEDILKDTTEENEEMFDVMLEKLIKNKLVSQEEYNKRKKKKKVLKKNE